MNCGDIVAAFHTSFWGFDRFFSSEAQQMPASDSLKLLRSLLRSGRETMRRQNDFEYDKFILGSRLIKPAIRLAWCLAACLALTALAQAQTNTTGSFQGSVSNQSGAPVIGASIQIRNTDTGVERSNSSDKDGSFSASLLGPGAYDITISAPGYQSQILRRTVYALQENQIIPLPVKLEPETVAVTPTPTPT